MKEKFAMNPGGEELAAEVRPVADLLDRLGESERASADGLERRVFAATRGVVAIDDALASGLGRAERESAPASFEDRVFTATRSIVGRGVPAPIPISRGRHPLWWVRRAAIAAGVGIAAWAALNIPSPGDRTPAVTAAELETRIDRRIAEFTEVVDASEAAGMNDLWVATETLNERIDGDWQLEDPFDTGESM